MRKQHILDRVVHEDSAVNLEAVGVLMHRLRKELSDSVAQIVTLRGLGYSLEPVDGAAH